MNKLTNYLFNHETTTSGKLKNIGAGFALMAVWIYIVQHFLGYVYYLNQTEPSNYFVFFTSCILAPLWEELVFRKVPLDMCGKIFKMKEGLILIVLFTSTIFGLCHGSPINIMIQGVMGFIMACIYIKNGFSYWSSVTMHFLWNFFATFGFKFISN